MLILIIKDITNKLIKLILIKKMNDKYVIHNKIKVKIFIEWVGGGGDE